MKFIKSFLLLTACLLLFTPSNLLAQRGSKVNYVSLINRASAPKIFIDDLIIPTADSTGELSIIFRLNNDFLPFKKLKVDDDIQAPDSMNYYSMVRLNAEIYEGTYDKRPEDDVNVASRDFWSDTLFTKTFEETESRDFYASGSLTNELKPGSYYYILQLGLMESANDRSSEPKTVRIPDFRTKKSGEVLLVSSMQDSLFRLMNLEDNVLFGEDFIALVRIPDYNDDNTYNIEVRKANVRRQDTTATQEVFTSPIDAHQIYSGVVPILSNDRQEPVIYLNDHEGGYTYAAVSIPHSEFENAPYLLTLTNNDTGTPLARTFFRSYWPDMPASLYNLEISIDHLKFILPEDQIKRMKEGDPAEKERKFRDFWDKRDPTPNTVYNELMAEYYRRIEQAFREFSNRGNLAGHESDMGKTYIRLGPPVDKERRFPPNGNVVEIWSYKGQQFIFEATSGFGDFKLVGREKK